MTRPIPVDGSPTASEDTMVGSVFSSDARTPLRTSQPRRLAGFVPDGYDKGRGTAWQTVWFATQNVVFAKWWCPARLRPVLLRLFGAQVGERVFIRHRVRVLWPWKLTIGDNSWIGEDAWLLNLEPIIVGNDVCISQGAFLCTGSHHHRDPTFGYDNAPISVGDGAWVATRAIVLRGTTIPQGYVVSAGAVVHGRSRAGAARETF